MLTLISSPTSPYARKVRVVLAEKQIDHRHVEMSPWTDDFAVHAWNPLGKVPVLLLDDGSALYDSRVIVEYLDDSTPAARLIPEPSRQRLQVRKWEALADGVSDAVLAIVVERRRSAEQQSNDWIDRQRRKIDDGVAALARELGERTWCNGESYTLADIATGCALAYLDLRHTELPWRDRYANLARLGVKLFARPSFRSTAVAA